MISLSHCDFRPIDNRRFKFGLQRLVFRGTLFLKVLKAQQDHTLMRDDSLPQGVLGTATPPRAGAQRVLIKAGQAERNYWYDLWRYRELFQVLAWRDVAVRYKQTVIGMPGHLSPLSHHDHIYGDLRKARQASVGWSVKVCADGLCWHAAVAVLCERTV